MADSNIRDPRNKSSLVGIVRWWILPCVLLFGLHWWLAGAVSVPQKGDELVYLGNARYLATGDGLVDPAGRDPYKIGYSLLLLPAFWLDASPLGGFAWVQVINGLLATALYPLLLLLARRLAPSLEAIDHALPAAVLACYPAALLYPTTAMSENAFTPLFVGVVWLTHRALGEQRRRDWVGLAALTVWLYYVHERSLGVLLTVVAVTLVVAVQGLYRRPRRWTWAWGLSAAAVVWALLRWVEVPGSRWQTGDRGGEFARQALALPESLLATGVGHLWYLMLASVGCLATGLALRCREAWRPAGEEPSSRGTPLFWWFLVGSAGSVLAISVIFLAQRPEAQFTHWVYGRYCEGVVLPVLLVALLALRRGSGQLWPPALWPKSLWPKSLWPKSLWPKTWGEGLGVASPLWIVSLASVLPLAWILDRLWTVEMGGAYSFNTTGLPIFNLPLGVGILRPTAVFLVVAGLLWLLFRWRWRWGMTALGAFFLLSTAVTLEGSWRPRAAEVAQQHRLADLVRQVDPSRRVILVEPLGKVYHFHYYNLSYFLPEYRFVVFGRQVQQAPPGDLVLSSDAELHRRHAGARLLGSEQMPTISLGYRQFLWVLPGKLSRRLERQGFWQRPEPVAASAQGESSKNPT